MNIFLTLQRYFSKLFSRTVLKDRGERVNRGIPVAGMYNVNALLLPSCRSSPNTSREISQFFALTVIRIENF